MSSESVSPIEPDQQDAELNRFDDDGLDDAIQILGRIIGSRERRSTEGIE